MFPAGLSSAVLLYHNRILLYEACTRLMCYKHVRRLPPLFAARCNILSNSHHLFTGLPRGSRIYIYTVLLASLGLTRIYHVSGLRASLLWPNFRSATTAKLRLQTCVYGRCRSFVSVQQTSTGVRRQESAIDVHCFSRTPRGSKLPVHPLFRFSTDRGRERANED